MNLFIKVKLNDQDCNRLNRFLEEISKGKLPNYINDGKVIDLDLDAFLTSTGLNVDFLIATAQQIATMGRTSGDHS